MIVSFDSLSDDEKLTFKRLSDLIKIAKYKNITRFSSFLNPREIEIAIFACKKLDFERYMFFGGVASAQRCIFGAFADYDDMDESAFPISIINFSFRKLDSLSHRDFLGSFMSRQISRESIGDIFVSCDGGVASAICINTIAPLLLETFKIGRVGVRAELGDYLLAQNESSEEEFKKVVSSNRLDVIVSALGNVSRAKSRELVLGGNVQVDYQLITNLSFNIKENSTISIRGFGKFVFKSFDGMSKKGKYIISYLKYK